MSLIRICDSRRNSVHHFRTFPDDTHMIGYHSPVGLMRNDISISCIESLEKRQLLHAIYVDPTFGTDGAVAMETQALDDQSDGKLIVALKEAGSGDASDLALMRL